MGRCWLTYLFTALLHVSRALVFGIMTSCSFVGRHLHASLVCPEDGGSRPVFVPNLLSDTASCPAVITSDVTGRSVLLHAVRNNYKGIES
jgi:hypothetical protein